MKTAMPEQELVQLNARIASMDRDIASRETALEERKEGFRAEGITFATLDPDTAREIAAEQAAIDKARSDVIALRDMRQHVSGYVPTAEDTPAIGGNNFAAEIVRAHGGGERILSGGVAQGVGLQAMTREQAVARLNATKLSAGLSRPLFGAVGADLDAGIPLDERLSMIVDVRRRQVRLLDLITVGATGSDTVVYLRQTTRTSAAAETALGTAYSEAAFDFEQETASVKDIGHWIGIHRSQAADAPQLETLIRGQLSEDVLLRLESQVLTGNGSGENLEGILSSGLSGSINSVDRDTTNERRVFALLRGMTKVRTQAFREPTACLIHPNDFQEMIIEEASVGGTSGGDPSGLVSSISAGLPMSVWGLPLVVSTVATEGTAVVAYWPEASLWVRSGVSVRMSDSHEDFFTRRQIALLAEMRGAFSVARPASFTAVHFL